jgi:site-specific recombinase XerD
METTKPPAPRLLDVVRQRIRLKHLSYTTEKSYIGWIQRFIRFHGRKHPREMGEAEIVSFLSYMAIERNCSPATQNQALNALVFLFKSVLGKDLGKFKNITWARRKQRVPEVMTRDEVKRVLEQLQHARQVHQSAMSTTSS